MPALDERQALDRAVAAWRRIVFGQRQSIRMPQQPAPTPPPQEQPRG